MWLQGEDTQWVTVDIEHPQPSVDDWVGVFSPAEFKYAYVYLTMKCLATFFSSICE